MRLFILFLTLVIITSSLKAETPKYMKIDSLQEYSTRSEIRDLVSILKKNSNRCLTRRNSKYCKLGKKNPYKATGWCYRYVKLGLLKSKMTSEYIGGGSAKDAGLYLEKEGFVNILSSFKYTPLNIPVGSVFVYGQPGEHGHIEVKISKNEYASDYVRKGPFYKIDGIYIKPLIKKLKELSQIERFLIADYPR